LYQIVTEIVSNCNDEKWIYYDKHLSTIYPKCKKSGKFRLIIDIDGPKRIHPVVRFCCTFGGI